MDTDALRTLERRVLECRATREAPGTTNRDNEPAVEWTKDGPGAVDALVARGGCRERASALNLDTCRGRLGGDARETVSGLEGLVLETFPHTCIEITERVRTDYGDTPSPREVATEVLCLDRDTARVLFDGPNWAGGSRAWIQPDEAAQAVRHVAQHQPPEQVWAHLDRRRLAAAHAAERPDEYLEPEVAERIDNWLQNVELLGYEPETGAPAFTIEPGDVELEREAILEGLRERQAWDSIAPSADIHPSTEIGHGVEIGEHASIGPGAVIDNHARVGAGAQIGAGTRVGAEISVGEGALVGERCNIQMTVGDGARVGDQCILAAAPGDRHPAYIPAGSTVPDHTVLAGRGPGEQWPGGGDPWPDAPAAAGGRPPADAPEPAAAAEREAAWAAAGRDAGQSR